MSEKRTRTVAAAQGLFVTFLWATSWVLIKVGLDEIPALTFAGLRYVTAFACLLIVAARRRLFASFRALSRRDWRRLAALGLLFYSVTQGAQFLALSYLPAVTVNLLFSFSSVAVTLMGAAFLRERPTGLQGAGVVLSTLGAVTYFHPAGLQNTHLWGVAAAIVGVFANSGAALLGRFVNREGSLTPLVVTLVSMGIGSLILLAAGIVLQGLPQLTIKSWLIILWLAAVNTAFAFTLWNQTLRTLSAMESSMINQTMIIWIPLLAVLFLGEAVGAKEVLGLFLVAVGVVAVQVRVFPGTQGRSRRG